jgi:4-aminobutyrate aminotransferase/(S)-3-amino-2-methylpropionate transaminase
MAVEQRTETERLMDERERYVARGISTPPLFVSRAEGARIVDVDGREYVDFAGGLGCQNTGHRLPAAVAAIHEQADRYLHQCAMVAMYEPYLDVCRRLAELSPCGSGEQRSLLVNSGAEGIENAVKIARAATGRPGVLVFGASFHGRTLLTLAMTGKVDYRRGFGPLPGEVYRAPAPYAYRGIDTEEALRGIELLFRSEVDPRTIACAVLEPVQGEGGFVVMPHDFPPRLKALCEEHGILYVDDEVQTGVGRTGPMWAIEHYGVEPDLLVSAKSLGGGLPLGAVTGRAEVMDAVDPGGLGGTFGGNPVACVAALAVLDEVDSPPWRARAEEIAAHLRARLAAVEGRVASVGEIRGLGPMLAMELVKSRETKEPAPELAKATTAAARERGLVLLSCGLYGNVIRILVPVVITDDDLEVGLERLEEALVDADAAAR